MGEVAYTNVSTNQMGQNSHPTCIQQLSASSNASLDKLPAYMPKSHASRFYPKRSIGIHTPSSYVTYIASDVYNCSIQEPLVDKIVSLLDQGWLVCNVLLTCAHAHVILHEPWVAVTLVASVSVDTFQVPTERAVVHTFINI